MTMYDRILILDTETGGLDPDQHSILTLGATVWHKGKIFGEFHVEIAEPEIVAGEKALEINKIDIDRLRREGVSPHVAVSLLQSFIHEYYYNGGDDKVILGGHNLSTFDVDFVKRLFVLAGVDYEKVFSHRVMDTCGIIRFLVLAGVLPLKGAGSNEAFEYYGIKPKIPHHALYDAIATAELLNCLLGTQVSPQHGDVIAGPRYDF